MRAHGGGLRHRGLHRHVEVDVSFGLPAFTMVGLPDASVRESRDRVRSAIRNSGFEFPPHRVTVNLAPADVRKAGSSFDLPIALGVLAATGRRHAARRGRRAAARRAVARRRHPAGARRAADRGGGAARTASRAAAARAAIAREAAVVDGLELYPVRSLAEAVTRAERSGARSALRRDAASADRAAPASTRHGDFADVHGQALARRALEIAAAGGHNILWSARPAPARR